MRKPFKFNELSDKRCACGSFIKKNLLAKKPAAGQCYKCFKKNK